MSASEEAEASGPTSFPHDAGDARSHHLGVRDAVAARRVAVAGARSEVGWVSGAAARPRHDLTSSRGHDLAAEVVARTQAGVIRAVRSVLAVRA